MRSAAYAVARCLTVRLSIRSSVTCRYSVDTAKHIVRVFFVPNGMVIFWRQPPNGDVECKGYEKIAIVDQ